jgi:hypothetical protein
MRVPRIRRQTRSRHLLQQMMMPTDQRKAQSQRCQTRRQPRRRRRWPPHQRVLEGSLWTCSEPRTRTMMTMMTRMMMMMMMMQVRPPLPRHPRRQMNAAMPLPSPLSPPRPRRQSRPPPAHRGRTTADAQPHGTCARGAGAPQRRATQKAPRHPTRRLLSARRGRPSSERARASHGIAPGRGQQHRDRGFGPHLPTASHRQRQQPQQRPRQQQWKQRPLPPQQPPRCSVPRRARRPGQHQQACRERAKGKEGERHARCTREEGNPSRPR